jgi:hypothetical protein
LSAIFLDIEHRAFSLHARAPRFDDERRMTARHLEPGASVLQARTPLPASDFHFEAGRGVEGHLRSVVEIHASDLSGSCDEHHRLGAAKGDPPIEQQPGGNDQHERRSRSPRIARRDCV